MALTIEQLYKARDFVELKNISATHVVLTFKNPILSMLAKGKIAEIAESCSAKFPFTSCKQEGNDIVLSYNPELVREYLLGEVFTGSDEKAKEAVAKIAANVREKANLA
jgi:hypothetical protein